MYPTARHSDAPIGWSAICISRLDDPATVAMSLPAICLCRFTGGLLLTEKRGFFQMAALASSLGATGGRPWPQAQSLVLEPLCSSKPKTLAALGRIRLAAHCGSARNA